VLNLAALAFTIGMAAFLMLFLNWHGLSAPCLATDTCDISQVAIHKRPFAFGSPLANTFKAAFLAIFSIHWLWSAATAAVEIWYAITRSAFHTIYIKVPLFC
jgi:hypothetical protein